MPRPVYRADFPDPGVVRDGGRFVAYATGDQVNAARGETASGPWRSLGKALPSLGPWAMAGRGVWAPDVVKTSAGWVMYYSAVPIGAKKVGDSYQRCIGVAVSKSGPGGPFAATSRPLICPTDPGAADRVPGRPVASAGVIDPSPFRASDGRRYVVYKTQQMPSSIRMLAVSGDGRSGAGRPSRELVRHSGIIEAPVMVERRGRFFLFVSRFSYANCSYATRWLWSSDRWRWTGPHNDLLTTAKTGLCGPGGADVAPSLDGGTRIFFHAWNTRSPSPTRRRQLYAGILTWGRDGLTPTVSGFLRPAG
ncbi:glycoside hydrolase family 43 protein [Thermomonospora umbrina]|uniref:Glycosyl hydrolase family 43 n=1 Tax=Thermomonospora umbrina TaxID=111806 RepID=A0A3D9T0V1_9ACTN|nr:glycoside hydrolase family 43 protein [Thermomonospora umbrina]REF00441.1 glycosyl hydrolase family 43 [Thermomonospora umbrina]